MRKSILTVFASTAILILHAFPATRYVDKTNTAGTSDGTALRPYITLGAAVTAAATGDSVKVAKGTYAENITCSKGITIIGGYVGGSASGYAGGTAGDFSAGNPTANVSTVQGNGSAKIFTLSGTVRVEGFRMTGGNGAVEITDGSPVVANCLLENNTAKGYGGGIFANCVDCRIENNTIRNNTSTGNDGKGAGIAAYGKKVTIIGNRIEGSRAEGNHGGGLYCWADSSYILNNYFCNNTAGLIPNNGGWGGAMVIFGSNAKTLIAGNIVTDNGNFGAIFCDDGCHATMVNNLVYKNMTGIYVDAPRSYADIINCTMANNGYSPTFGHMNNYGFGLCVSADPAPDNTSVRVRNCIISGNWEGYKTIQTPPVVNISYSILQKAITDPGVVNGAGIIVGDPLFADTAHANFRLKSAGGRWNDSTRTWVIDAATSPGVDAGDPTLSFVNEPAPNGGRVNIGYDGNTAYASKSTGGSGLSAAQLPILARRPELRKNTPNPFQAHTMISYSLPKATAVHLAIYDAHGRQLAVLVEKTSPAGEFSAAWNPGKNPAGIYFCRLQAGSYVDKKSMMLLR